MSVSVSLMNDIDIRFHKCSGKNEFHFYHDRKDIKVGEESKKQAKEFHE